MNILKVSTFFNAETKEEKTLCEVYLNSDEDKPTAGIAGGSIAVETDTGKVSFYDETDGWVEQFSFQS